jgi:hypothetical protein
MYLPFAHLVYNCPRNALFLLGIIKLQVVCYGEPGRVIAASSEHFLDCDLQGGQTEWFLECAVGSGGATCAATMAGGYCPPSAAMARRGWDRRPLHRARQSWQNGFKESFNDRFRDKSLNPELLANVLKARCVGRTLRDNYNTVRLQSSIAYRTPADYRAELLDQAPDSGQASRAGPSLRP